ncbi:MAG TPA: glucohydrolase [Chloroflexi bacterium]|nr:glucohydrolase [Chloroflexota bacterium]
MRSTPPWWQTTTIYQIYPRSFADANHDGIGDLRGVISKLDYIQDLGFETIWISPFFRSPQQDFGYDVSDYGEISPEYGTLAEVDELIEAVHARGLRILFDLVLNHTSIEHPWFRESRSSRDNPKRDWYLWRTKPNNWKALPGGSGWHYDEISGEYYYANFLSFQPDLNWRNPEVKKAMFDVVRFWLDKGVDGFRLDIFHSIYKDGEFRDNPFSGHFIPKDDQYGFFQEFKYNLNQPEVFKLAKELRTLAASYTPERMLIGEVFGSTENQKRFLGENLDGLNLAFLWELLNLKASAPFLRQVIQFYESHYPAPYTPVYVFGNHDRKRLISLIDNDLRLAKLLAIFQFTVRGVPVTYYGEEIGMADGNFPAKNALDPIGRRYAWAPQFLINQLGLYVNRDGCRTPMQWNANPNAGFCDENACPWLPVHKNRRLVNVQDQLGDDSSLLELYRRLLRLRRASTTLQSGTLELIRDSAMDENILAYKRAGNDQTILVALNFGDHPVELPNPTGCRQVLLSVGWRSPSITGAIQLPAFGGVVLGD